jgi:hypothetical protein
MVRLLFALTVFLSASLTFTVQPLIGKQLLPLVGGTPGVWNTCLVFFQAVLLLGYLAAHGLTRIRNQLLVHVGLLLAAGAAVYFGGLLKPNESLIPADVESPIGYVLLVLVVAVGAPFLVLSMTAPLLQKWYAGFGRNPYPLYAASNLGSFAGLIGYPLVIEPNWPVGDQRWWWVVGFGVCAGLIVGCGWGSRSRRNLTSPAPPPLPGKEAGGLGWSVIFLSALPSSLLLSVTTHLTTDIAPVPLLWVLPLGLYLLSFVIVFGHWPASARRVVGRFTPMLLCFLCVALLSRAAEPMSVVAAIHLITFFAVALLCHGELAARKPDPQHLTAFYLGLSVGGVVGGLVNTFVAPVVFARLGNVEYPLAIVLAALVRSPDPKIDPRVQRTDWLPPLLLLAVTFLLVFSVILWLGEPTTDNPADEMIHRVLRGGLMFGIPCIIAFAFARRSTRFALGLAAVLLIGWFAPTEHGTVLETSRNFFGTLRVTRSQDNRFIRLVHGTTQHGQQSTDRTGPPQPAMYYHRKGPLGHLFAVLPPDRWNRVGAVGLGAGAAAAYAEPGQTWTFYEIDPAVVRIARDERYFTFLSSCPAKCEVILGDARRQLMTAPDASFDLLILDAFSSDAVPVHLLTKEAFELYLRKLGARGVLAFHVSNRYLDLARLVARVANAVHPTLEVRWQNDTSVSEQEKADGKNSSIWVIIGRTAADLPTRPDGKPDFRWQKIDVKPGPVWTDDFSHLLGVWKQEEE